MVGVQQAVGENAEVPGFTSISRHGVVHRCVAYYDRDAKSNGLPINVWARPASHMRQNGQYDLTSLPRDYPASFIGCCQALALG
jgi:hypothetical protein